MSVKSAEARKQEIRLKQDDQIMSSRDTVEFSEHIFKNDPSTDLDKDVSTATDLDNAESSVAVSHIPLNTPVYHEYISTPDNSVSALDSMDRISDFEYCSDSQSHKASISTPTEGSYNFHKGNSIDKNDHNDQGDDTLLCNISVLSNVHGFRSGNTMQESELAEPTAFHEELIPKGVKSAEAEQQQTQVIQDEIMSSLYTLEFSDHISKSHPDADLDMNVSPVTDVIKNMSFVTDLNLDMSASHLYISTP